MVSQNQYTDLLTNKQKIQELIVECLNSTNMNVFSNYSLDYIFI
jgi:hypothetical protein